MPKIFPIVKKVIAGGGQGVGLDMGQENEVMAFALAQMRDLGSDDESMGFQPQPLLTTGSENEAMAASASGSATFPQGSESEAMNFSASQTRALGTENEAFAILQTVLNFFLSGSAGTGVASPANANGVSDGANAVVETAALGSTTETLTSDAGVDFDFGGAALTITQAIYRGWFRARTTLVTSTAEVILHSTTGEFADITMFTQSSLNGDTNHLSGTFTFDLLAGGVPTTAASLASFEVLHRTTDAVAGVTPAILDVDAGSIEITATF